MRVAVVLGTRPEAVKLAPVIVALRRSEHEVVVVSTGQHRDLLAPILRMFDIVPDVDLDLRGHGRDLATATGTALIRTASALAPLGLDAVIVQGDTLTTLAGALAGFQLGIPVVHVEAGLRTDDLRSPFPEEGHRRMVTRISDLHLAPTEHAASRLRAEGVPAERVVVTGNTGIDALLSAVARDLPFEGAAGDAAARLAAIEAAPGPMLLVTVHRREAWDAGVADVAAAVRQLLDRHPPLYAVLPLHPNPIVRDAVVPVLADHRRAVLTEPVGYADMVRLLRRADLVLTDSGGLQEEACTLGVPVLVTRSTTERPEGEAAGGLRVVGTDPARIVAEVGRLLDDPLAREALRCTSLPFGDGRAADRVVRALDLLTGPQAEPRPAAHATPASPAGPAGPASPACPDVVVAV
ncbi:UDP-N-acetylglucosamine 2-epimerase (non-hydrolyzing) [Nocardioides fonticola]|uniref:UDP-N-acetylglucosamine 2-epimerase (non-hydrolyzing) n=1 Tax=Nocardioides fonticola TaxID=450363 RepID=A0ABP7XGU6_9ACTN